MAVALFVTFSARTVIQKYLSLVVKRIRVGPNRVGILLYILLVTFMDQAIVNSREAGL